MERVRNSGGGENGYFDLSNIIPRLEGLRTLIVYDSPYAVRNLLFYHIISHFSSKNLFIAVFSDTMYRRLEKTYESISKASPHLAELLNKTKIIKIGLKNRVSFGELYRLINPDLTWYKKFFKVVKEFDHDDAVIFYGFSIIPLMYGQRAMVDILKLFDSMSDNVTLISKYPEKLYDEAVSKLMERFYDVVMKVERTEEFFGFEETYTIGVDQSIVIDVKPGFARFKVGEDGRLIKV